MDKLAAKMGRDQKERKLRNMDAADTNGAIMIWAQVYAEIAGRVTDYRGSFMRLAIGAGKSAAQAILKKVEADATIGDLMVGGMQKLQSEWDESYMKAFMKLEVTKLAAAKVTAGSTEATSEAL